MTRGAVEELVGGGFTQALRRVPAPLLHVMMALTTLLALAPLAFKLMQPDGAALAPTALVVVEPKQAASRTRCHGCGVVEALRLIPASSNTPETYEFIVRMRDGSLRSSIVASKSTWRVGDRIILMGGEAAR